MSTDDHQWVRKSEDDGSWHIFVTYLRTPDQALTRCNERADASTVRNDLPMTDKSCESCFRLVAHDADVAGRTPEEPIS